MPEVLHVLVDDTRVHRLGAPAAVLDPCTAAVLDEAVEAARRDAFREGEVAGRAAAREEHAAATAGLIAAFDVVRADLAAHREEATRASTEFARAVASAVLDRTPPPEALEVLDRARLAAGLLDDAPLRVELAPADVAAIGDRPIDAQLELVADPRLARGEARVVGASSGVELSRAALLDAALELLGGEPS